MFHPEEALDWFLCCQRKIEGLVLLEISSQASKSVPRSECSWFPFSFQDENLVFEDFARQNLKDSGDLEEGKKVEEAAVDE